MIAKLTRFNIRAMITIGVCLSLFPFYWLLVTASETSDQLYSMPPKLTFGHALLTNITTVFTQTPFVHALGNTLFIATISTVCVLFFDSLAGFTFAKIPFKGKKPLFAFLLLTMTIPGQLSIIPSFYLMDKLGWIGSYKALIVPGMANAFGIFWLNQYCHNAIPDSLLEEARLEGCSIFRCYVLIGLPLMKPALVFLGLFTFMGSWNDYMWPLIILNDQSKYTLMLALTQLKGLYTTNYPLVITGALLAVAPLILLFILFAKQIMSGVINGTVKQ